MINCKVAETVMSVDVISELAGKLSYTLSKERLDGRHAYSIGISQTSKDGFLTTCDAHDVSAEEEAATEMFLEISGGEVETSVFFDVIYDLLP